MTKTVQGTQSFSRNIDLLQHIADRPQPPVLRELMEECNLTRPTLYRLLAGLEAEDMIIQTTDRRYKLGPRLVTLARRALAQSDIRDIARSLLETLRDRTGETVHLAIPSGAGLVYIDKIESHETVRMGSTIGTFVPLYSSGVGKAYLAALPNEKCEAMLEGVTLDAITPFTTTNPETLQAQIETCRSDGYIFDDQENEVGIACFGAAIFDDRGLPAAAVSVSVPLYRLREDPDSYAKPLLECVKAISGNLGSPE